MVDTILPSWVLFATSHSLAHSPPVLAWTSCLTFMSLGAPQRDGVKDAGLRWKALELSTEC